MLKAAAVDPLVSPYARADPREFARRGARVVVINILIALVLAYASGHFSWATLRRGLAYGTGISLCSWAFIDFGRFLLSSDPETGWPRGLLGVLLPVFGCAAGFAVGSALGDLMNGFPVYSGYTRGMRSLTADLMGSMAIGAAFSGFYYLRGKGAYQHARLLRAERDLTLARLSMLQAQLEPHMLFNTLANLRVLIGLDAARAQSMLDHMIAYLRATLDGSRAASHPLANEFERLADFLALMAVRMGPRLQVRFDLPDGLRHLPVPPMLLQPLVENCIKHGLEPKLAGGAIEVSAARLGDQLVLTVRDTGVGLSGAAAPLAAATAAAAVSAPGGPTAPGDARFGVTQVRERLAALYGARADFTLAPAGDARGGTLARLRLPIDNTPSDVSSTEVPSSGAPSA